MSDFQELTSKKQQLRREIRAELAQLSRAEVVWRSAEICAKVRGRLAASGCRQIAAFVAMATEPDLSALWTVGLEIAVPKVSGARLTFWWVRDPGGLRPGYRGILEPDATQGEQVEPGSLDAILVPGLAFSAGNGLRLGQGGGFYDRLLSEVPEVARWGICFDEQVREFIPGGAQDARMDVLITCRRELTFENGRQNEKKA